MKRLYIDAMALTDPRISGIGNTLLNTVRALENDAEFAKTYQLYLVVPYNKVQLIERWHFKPETQVVKHYLPGKIMNGLIRLNLLPPMDLLLGRGVYLFPNFRNWPLQYSPSLTYIHDVSFKEYPQFVEPRNLAWLQRFVPKWIARTTVVVTVSQHAKNEIIKYFPSAKEKIVVVPNGVNGKLFYQRPASEQRTLQDKYGIKKPYFMFLSNLEPRKNVEVLLEAFRQVDSRKNLSLLLVGGMGWLNEPILQKIQQLNDEGHTVIRPGQYVPEEDLPALLSGAIGLVHPALYEGFGIAPLEAMSCGTPVIAANNSSLPEVIQNAGILVDTDDAHAYAQAMNKLINDGDLVTELSRRGLERAKGFSWANSANALRHNIETKL